MAKVDETGQGEAAVVAAVVRGDAGKAEPKISTEKGAEGGEILASESLAVLRMCRLVIAGNRRILIAPGVALGYQRYDLLSHPCQATGLPHRIPARRGFKQTTQLMHEIGCTSHLFARPLTIVA